MPRLSLELKENTSPWRWPTRGFQTIAAVRSFSGLEIRTVLARNRKSSTHRAVLRRDRAPDFTEGDDDANANLEHLRDMASEAPVIRLVNAMIATPSKARQRYHIEPSRKSSRAFPRGRRAVQPGTAAARAQSAIISRLKLMPS